ncbi:hypothetical protein CPB83DRAFT_831438 [Crepidotus variabilis]|uniref:C2H2-type domain-containing protein n=1 Tax=Crepidotus variabilis TaxID=179855 RepID=A0A9P6ESW7_9AGAR|nr:hypothetical protein CPB83DRAFT_831438 [Crepidotus variabilis]
MTFPLRSSTYPLLTSPISSTIQSYAQPPTRSTSSSNCQCSSTQMSLGNSLPPALPSFGDLCLSLQLPEAPRSSLDSIRPFQTTSQHTSTQSKHASIGPRPTLLLDTHMPFVRPHSSASTRYSDDTSPSSSGRYSIPPSEASESFSDLSSVETISDEFRRTNEAALVHVVEREDPATRDLWETYIQKVGAKDKGNDLVMCIHIKKQKKGKLKAEDTDHPVETCGYVALKQTVKRHINSTHLGISPFVCDFCGSRFSQRQAAVIHVNGSQ